MKVRLSAYWHTIINIVLFGFPSIVKRIIQGKLKEIIEKRSFNVQECHPEIESEKLKVKRMSSKSQKSRYGESRLVLKASREQERA